MHENNLKRNASLCHLSYMACLFLTMLFMSGCMPAVRGGATLSQNMPSDLRVERKVWIKRTSILDPAVTEERNAAENSFTLNILEYIREGNYFKTVDVLPGKVGPEDLVLHFQFDRYRQDNSFHPAFIPLSVLTLGLYAWCGGVAAVDDIDYSGVLTVEDFSGAMIARVSARIAEKQNVSYWDSIDFPNRIETRTRIVNTLLDNAIVELNLPKEEKGFES